MKAARFEFQECSEGFQNAQGTRIFTEDGEIQGVVGATIEVEAGDVVRAEVRLLPVIDKIEGAEAHFVIEHPIKGGFEEVSKIIFADGSEVDFGEAEIGSDDPEEIETVTLKSTAREFVFGIKPPANALSDAIQRAKDIQRRLFDIAERKRWTKAINRAWFALKA